MYEKIEKLYREKSVNNIIFRKSFSFYIVTLIILCLSGIYQKFLYIMPFYIYRNLCSNQRTLLDSLLDFGFWITCAISVVAPFLEASGINATLVIEMFKRLLIVFFYVGIFYWIFKHFFITVQSLYGNYNINKNLEKIFSDIFLEMNKTKFAKESKNFNKRKKLRKQIPKLKV